MSPLKLVLVDDHDAAREALVRRLRKDARLCVAHTAGRDEALRLVGEQQPHVALVDTRREDGAGMDVVAAIAGLPRERRPVIAVHASFFDGDEWLRARAAGADDWILKQIDIDALVRRLSEAVREVLPPDRWPSLG